MNKEKTTALIIRIPIEMKEKVEKRANDRYETVSAYIRKLILVDLKKNNLC